MAQRVRQIARSLSSGPHSRDPMASPSHGLTDHVPWNFGAAFHVLPVNMTNRQGITTHEARPACFDLLPRMHDRQDGIGERCGAFSSGSARKIASAGCRRERDSSGACECARTEWLGLRSERHRQCGQGARDTAANNNAGHPAHRIASCCLPNCAGAGSGQGATNAICGIEMAALGGASGCKGTRPAARPQDNEHLQGMLNSDSGSACRARGGRCRRPSQARAALGDPRARPDSRLRSNPALYHR